MTLMLNFRAPASCLAGLLAILLAGVGMAQEAEKSLPLFVNPGAAQEEPAATLPGKARALLDELKKGETDRQLAVKQTEIDRLKQDREKTELEAANLQKTIDSATALVAESDEEISKMTSESRRLEHELAVTQERIAAERLKTEGLRALSAAQTKSLSALARHAEETEARTRLRSAELALLREGKPLLADARDESQSEIGKCRKALALAEAKAQAEERAAQEAIKAATVKMAAAEARAATAKRMADNDLTLIPVAEKTKGKAAGERKESDPAARKSPAVTASSAPKPAPKPVATPNPAARGPFFGR
jgi:chromosome segregation ATPase